MIEIQVSKPFWQRQYPRYRNYLIGLAVVGSLVAATTVTASAAQGAPASSTVSVTVNLSGPSIGSLPARYLGLSYESGDLNSGQFDRVGDLPALLENLGTGVVRFGGNSVDRASYDGISGPARAGLARLARATDWHVIYSVNVGHFSAAAATADARNVARALGGHLTAIACGNEPDAYAHNGNRPPSYTETTYLKDAAACIKAVRHGAPGVHIAGPDTFTTRWLPPYAAAEKGTISLLDEHLYPLNNCHGPSGTAATLISRTTAEREAAAVAAAAGAARRAGVPLRMSETNSAACGGIPGVSNTYAAALWAADYVLIAAEHGASGVNFHGFLSTHCDGYTPLCQTAPNQYQAQPVYYGLLFAHLLGTGHLLTVTVHSSARITAHAVKGAKGTVRVVIENLTGSRRTVVLHLGHISGTAAVLHLTGPSLTAPAGVRIQGAAVRTNGTFSPGAPSHILCRSGSCRLSIPAYSAVIVTLP